MCPQGSNFTLQVRPALSLFYSHCLWKDFVLSSACTITSPSSSHKVMHTRLLAMWPPPAFWLHLPPLCSHSANYYLLSPGVLFLSWTLTIHTNPSRHSSSIHTKGYKDAHYSQHCQSLPDNPASPFSPKHMNPWGVWPSTSTGPGQVCPKGKSWPSKMAYLRAKNILMNPINILGIYTMSCAGDTYEERKWTLRKEDEITCC